MIYLDFAKLEAAGFHLHHTDDGLHIEGNIPLTSEAMHHAETFGNMIGMSLRDTDDMINEAIQTVMWKQIKTTTASSYPPLPPRGKAAKQKV